MLVCVSKKARSCEPMWLLDTQSYLWLVAVSAASKGLGRSSTNEVVSELTCASERAQEAGGRRQEAFDAMHVQGDKAMRVIDSISQCWTGVDFRDTSAPLSDNLSRDLIPLILFLQSGKK